LIAPARRTAALPPHHWRPAFRRPDYWRQAAEIRREWLEIGLSTEPADRAATEEAIASIYAQHHRARPEFRWVLSPRAALPHLTGLPTHEALRSWVDTHRPPGRPPIASDIAATLSRLRSDLAEGFTEPVADRPLMKRPKDKPWPRLAPPEAIDGGLPFQELLRQGIREALFRSLADGVYLPIRAALATAEPAAAASERPTAVGQLPAVADRSPAAGGEPFAVAGQAPAAGGELLAVGGRAPVVSGGAPVLVGAAPVVAGGAAGSALPVGWYGHQDAAWVGHLDVLRRLGLVPGGRGASFDVWVALARAGGWWWPGEQLCVLVERPAVIRTEPVPGAWHDEVRLRRVPGEPAVEYRDGWTI
jgi:hypothetical protein